MTAIDHRYTENIVCPYCGHEHSDSYEYRPGEEDIGLVECEHCEREFMATRIVSITYTTVEVSNGN